VGVPRSRLRPGGLAGEVRVVKEEALAVRDPWMSGAQVAAPLAVTASRVRPGSWPPGSSPVGSWGGTGSSGGPMWSAAGPSRCCARRSEQRIATPDQLSMACSRFPYGTEGPIETWLPRLASCSAFGEMDLG
jgi:hypothetical protein